MILQSESLPDKDSPHSGLFQPQGFPAASDAAIRAVESTNAGITPADAFPVHPAKNPATATADTPAPFPIRSRNICRPRASRADPVPTEHDSNAAVSSSDRPSK